MMERLKCFLEMIGDIPWLLHSGEPSQIGRVVDGMQGGWDGEGKQMLKIWGQQTLALEGQALEALGDEGIDQIFSSVSDAIGDPLYKGISDYLERIYSGTKDTQNRTFDDAVIPEVVDSVKRDLCWAGVEHVLGVRGFFTTLLEIYRQGRWPCSWDGEYPEGRPVLL